MGPRGCSSISILVVGALACSSGSSGSPPADGGTDAFVCVDTTGGNNAMASIDDVFNSTRLLCPLELNPGANPTPESYDQAKYVNCGMLGMTSGDVQYGPCLNYLVWEADLDSSGTNFSKCFYDLQAHDLVGVIFGDGTQDQCGGQSYTVQAGSVETCTISGLNSPGTGGMFEDCRPKPEGGVKDAGAD
jgi:hypothetical protein